MGLYDSYVTAQATIQAAIEPSRLWRGSNSKRMRYQVQAGAEEVTRRITETVAVLDNSCENPTSGNPMRFKLLSHKPGKYVSMFILTPYWCDKATFEVHPEGQNKCSMVAFARSTGVLPIVLPFSFLINTALFFVPFTDALGKMSKYVIKQVVQQSGLQANVL